MIELGHPLCFSEIGRKDDQEDFLYPPEASRKSRVFILCDGVGGHDNGEVASMTAATALGRYLDSCGEIDSGTFQRALVKAYDALDGIDTHSGKKPGTTLTCLCFNEDSFLVAHIGDSRIYHIRPSLFNPVTGRGGIIYQSSDHSLVNDLLKAGELTEEEAQDFPGKNIITRAMQPHQERRDKADVFMFDDIASGDYFFLCSDGILERLSNDELCRVLADGNLTDEMKLGAIKAVCDGHTRDNYTCWLIPISKADVKGEDLDANIIMASEETHGEPSSDGNQQESMQQSDPEPMAVRESERRSTAWSVFVLCLSVISIIVWIVLKLTHVLR